MSADLVDASVAVKWVLPENGVDPAVGLLRHRLIAPDLFAIGCANLLWRQARRGVLSAEEAVATLGVLVASGIEITGSAAPLDGVPYHAHPVTGGLLLGAAAGAGLPVVTADPRLERLAGDGAGVLPPADLPAA
ncbi:type II toxin-antitoxin system VapC family toxin [Muricoccus radiodurans]|uniref:type II toxin-antitoxin system VapC family toxin n=1 Tax=Muricoccus radiodurans TaxID=2231721 RepID=UPI003CEC2C06